MGGKGSAPPPPDYIGAANTQAAASKELTNIQNFANRPTINTPFGSQSWQTSAQVDPATGQYVTSWTQNNTLAPALQSALNAQIGLQNDRSQLASGFMDRVASEYQRPFDYANLPQMAEANSVGNLQTGLADYTRGLQTGVDSRANNVVSGFNFGGPQMSMSPMTGNMVNSVAQTPVDNRFSSMTGDVQRAVPNTNVNANFSGMTGDLRRGTGTESLQRSLATGDNPALPQIDGGFRDQVATQLMTRMQPVHDYQRQQLETRLANQGFDIGSEGYKRALDELNQRQAAERFNALDQSGAEAQRLFGMQMGARQQAFNEDVSGGNFFNQAANQAFNQGLAANQFANQATGQAFNQAMQAQQAGNQALGQQFNQNLAAGQFGNSAVQQAYAQAMGATEAANRAAAQQFNQAMGAGQFQNQAANQAFNQTLGAFNFGNQAQQQLYGQLMGQANLANQAAGQQFNQDLQARQFQNQALGQASALDIARMQAQNQAAAQQFGLNQQFADARNRLRQQAIAEQMQRRGMSLNEMNALLSGQQVNMPNMPSFAAAQRSETPNILGATQMGYDAALGAYNAQQAGFGNLLNAGAQIGSAAFMFSDRRLKSNIKRVGTHSTGVGIYDYTMMGMPQRGVIAQEVERVRPDLVKRHANGYLMVNYGGL
jgi:hypothetical protein